MITARDARNLVVVSDESIKRHLDIISAKITELATNGASSVLLDYVSHHIEEYRVVDRFAYQYPEYTPLQKRIRDELVTKGFQVKIIQVMTQIGGGLGSMDDEVKEQPVHHIEIKW
jgi:hypothetical protein